MEKKFSALPKEYTIPTSSFFAGYDAVGTVTWPTSAMQTYVWSQSANYGIDRINPLYTVVNANSATTWNYQGTDVKSLTSNWQNTYTTVNTGSATWVNQTYLEPHVYYVTTNGNDSTGDGSATNPFLTLTQAYIVGVAAAHDFIINVGIGSFSLALGELGLSTYLKAINGRGQSSYVTITANTNDISDLDSTDAGDIDIEVNHILLDVYSIAGSVYSSGSTYTCGNGGNITIRGNSVLAIIISRGGAGDVFSTGQVNAGNAGDINILGNHRFNGGSGAISNEISNGVNGGTNGNAGNTTIDGCDLRDISTLNSGTLSLGRCSYTTGLTITSDRGGNAAY